MGFTVNETLLGGDADDDASALPVGVYPEDQPVPADRVHLFSANGRVYTAPKQVDRRLVFRYLRSLRQRQDSMAAVADLLGDALGDPVIDALAEEELTPDQFDQVMRVIEKYVLGAAESALGNSSGGRGR